MAKDRDRNGLTTKYKKFCDIYLANGGNATQAWKTAGSGAKTAGTYASQLLKKPAVKNYIAEREAISLAKLSAKVVDKLQISRENVIQVLQDIMFNGNKDRDKISAAGKIAEIMGYIAPKQSEKLGIELKFTENVEMVEKLTKEIKERERGF